MAANPDGPKAKLEAKGVAGQCEACGANSWAIGRDRSALVTLSPSGALTGQGLPVYTMICNTCGYVRMFHADLL